MAGRPSPRHPSLSQLTSQPETITSCYPENAPHRIPTTFRTAPRYLELQEVIIPGKKRGPPYAKGEQTIEPAKFAKTIVSAINSKAIKYPPALEQPLDLLIYPTHWRFVPNPSVLQLVCDSLHKSSHPFSNIYFFNRLNENESQRVNLFPSKELLAGFNREEAEATAYVNFDPGSGEAFKDGDRVGVRFALTPTVTKKLIEPKSST
jgi:hypothetical protein